MNTQKCNGPDARNDRPAKAQINYATNFIAAYACASGTGSTFNSEIQANTSPKFATQARTPAKTHVTDVTAVTAPIHAGLRCNVLKISDVTAVTARGIKPPTCSALQKRFKVRPAVHAGADRRHDAGVRVMNPVITHATKTPFHGLPKKSQYEGWGMVRYLPTLDDAELFLSQIGGAHA